MRTAGVDFASQDRNTAACVVEWSAGAARVVAVQPHVADRDVTVLAAGVDKLGIDVPLGWPTAFAAAVAMHSRRGGWPTDYAHAASAEYRYRRTDLFIRRQPNRVGRPSRFPLSVSTDQIAIPAMRAAALLAGLEPPVPLDGSGVVVEVYPAAALRRWGFDPTRYKGRPVDRAERLDALVSAVAAASRPWLSFAGFEPMLRRNHNVFDAFVSALIARAAAVATVEAIPAADRDAARREGWIALPVEDSFARLAQGS